LRAENVELRATLVEQAKTHAAAMKVQAARVAELEGKLAAVMAAMEVLERKVLGSKSERMPPPQSELRHKETDEDAEERRLAALRRRRERAALKEKLRAQTVTHLTEEQRRCPRCGGRADRPIGGGKATTVDEYIPGYFVRQEHMQEEGCVCLRQLHRHRGAAAQACRGPARLPSRNSLSSTYRRCAASRQTRTRYALTASE